MPAAAAPQHLSCVAQDQYVVRLFVTVPPSPELTPEDLGRGQASAAMGAMLRLSVVDALDGAVSVGQILAEPASLSGEFRETVSMFDNSVSVPLVSAEVDMIFCSSAGVIPVVEGQFGPKFITSARGFAMLHSGTVQFIQLTIPATTTTTTSMLLPPSTSLHMQHDPAAASEDSDGIKKWLWLFPVLLIPPAGLAVALVFRLLWHRHLRDRWVRWRRGGEKSATPVSAWGESTECDVEKGRSFLTAKPTVEEMMIEGEKVESPNEVTREVKPASARVGTARPPDADPDLMPITEETAASLSAKSVKVLKGLAHAHKISIERCVEKSEIVDRILASVAPKAAESAPLRGQAAAAVDYEASCLPHQLLSKEPPPAQRANTSTPGNEKTGAAVSRHRLGL